MPLKRGKSQKAFESNIKTEYEAGKPLKQSLAIAYAMKRKKKMAEGGGVGAGRGKYQVQAENEKGVHTPISGIAEYSKKDRGTSRAGDLTKSRYGGEPLFSGSDHPAIAEHKKVLGEMKSMPKPNLYAEGGKIGSGHQRKDNERGVHQSFVPDSGQSMTHQKLKPAFNLGQGFSEENAKEEHREKLKELQGMKKPNLYAEGGDVHMCSGGDCTHACHGAMMADGGDPEQTLGSMIGYPGSGPKPAPKPQPKAEGGLIHDDLVDRIIQRRSEGGMIANDTDDEVADSDSANFDDLANRDHLAFSETGANSGDHLGNERLEEDEHDIVNRIMRQRSMKQRNPRPA